MGAQAVRLSNVDIDNALKNKDFEVLFQPIFDLGNGALARVETFVRWRHKSLGLLPPGAFISFFETQGRMSELTRYVLAEALTAYTDWRGPYPPGLSINLALSDLSDDTFASHFAKLLRDKSFPADLITLECPMPAMDAEKDTAAAHYEKLSQTGARLAIEVRGRANDFLRDVKPFPFDEIKTGGSAILRFARTVRGPGLSAIADLLDIANDANAAITAVGVEDQASLAALRGLGFTAAQGNHLAKVGAIDDFKPAEVNKVRALLDLEELNSEDLNALFRTASPAPQSGEGAKRARPRPETTPAENENSSSLDEERKKKARALALAKRAKAREARKAAAIERVKAKSAQSSEATAPQSDPFETPHAPRELQKRLSEEFGNDSAQPAEAETKAETDVETDVETVAPITTKVSQAEQAKQAAKAETNAAPPPEQKPREQKKAAPPASLLSASKEDTVKNSDETVHEKSGMPASAQKASQPEHALSASPTRAAPAAPDAKEPISKASLKLPIGRAGARLLPIIRVAGPDHIGNAVIQAPNATPEQPSAEDEQLPPKLTPANNVEELPEPGPSHELKPEPETLDPLFEAPAKEDTAAASEPAERAELPSLLTMEPSQEVAVNGDLPHEEETSGVTAQRPQKKQKNIFMRKYRLMPTHFWPKSWKRRFLRMKQRKTSNEDAALAAAVTD